MLRLFRILLYLTISGLIVLGIGLWLAYYLSTRSLPDYNASYEFEDLSGDVEIVRDTYNVPHIFGARNEDTYFGLGFAHAQDRLFQMMLMRRTAEGRLSEVFGESTLQSDSLMRHLGLYTAAKESLRAQSPDAQAALEAYARGVNAWIEHINDNALGRGAPEFFLFPSEIAYWTPADSLALLKLLALQSSDHAEREVLRASLALVLPPERLADILPDSPPRLSGWVQSYAALLEDDITTRVASLPPLKINQRGASNMWVSGPERSALSASVMANDPHVALSAPAAFYLARLELENGGLMGASIPGIPAILAGRRDQLGWAITASYVDDMDLYVEALNPDDPNQVRTAAGYQTMVARPSIVRIKDEAPITLTLRRTQNGPVLPRLAFGTEAVTPPGHVMALNWTGLSTADTSMSALIGLNMARNLQQGEAALSQMIAPTYNVILSTPYRSVQLLAGAAPRRTPDHQSQGRIPSAGWAGENIWQGMRAKTSYPRIEAERDDILGNTNNKITEDPFPNHLSFGWGDTQRILRWERLIQAREIHTRESFIEMQTDIVSPAARALLPLVGAELWFTGEAAPSDTLEGRRQVALALLAEWNGEMNEHLPEPLIYAAWMRALQNRLIRDDLGPLATQFSHIDPLFIERVFRNIGGASAWCDVIQSAPRESCSDVARLALDDALVWIEETYNAPLESLRWGDAHQAHHDHLVLGSAPFLNWVANIRQSTSGGDHTLMRGMTRGTGDNPFANVHGAGYRGVYDFADPDSSLFIIPTGQSGHPLSRHYDNLGVLWRRGEYIAMTLDPDLARAANVGITRLSPSN